MPVVKEIEQRDYVGGTGIPTDFEVSLFAKYLFGNGSTYNMSKERFDDIAIVAKSGAVSSESTVTIGGQTYTKKVVSFYSSNQYDYAFGRATVYYDSAGKAVGFKDRYDFNALPEGERDSLAEHLTGLASGLGTSFNIFYGVHD